MEYYKIKKKSIRAQMSKWVYLIYVIHYIHFHSSVLRMLKCVYFCYHGGSGSKLFNIGVRGSFTLTEEVLLERNAYVCGATL